MKSGVVFREKIVLYCKHKIDHSPDIPPLHHPNDTVPDTSTISELPYKNRQQIDQTRNPNFKKSSLILWRWVNIELDFGFGVNQDTIDQITNLFW